MRIKEILQAIENVAPIPLQEDFDNSENEGFLPIREGCLIRLNGAVRVCDPANAACGLPAELRALILAVLRSYPYLLRR